MSSLALLELPFFDATHRGLSTSLQPWIAQHLSTRLHDDDADVVCRAHVRTLGDAGWLRYCVPAVYGGATPEVDSRSLCLLRQALGRADGLADFAFAMQGLGSVLVPRGRVFAWRLGRWMFFAHRWGTCVRRLRQLAKRCCSSLSR